MDELRDASAGELAAGFAAGKYSPVEVTDHALTIAEKINTRVNCLFQVEAEAARAAALQSTKRWASGTQLSALDGVPTAVKDGIDAAGWPNNRGSAANPAQSPISNDDAPAVARQREAGMVLLGKATMCDYGMLASGLSSRYGPTRNPWNLSANTSGSSSGSAASIAAGICQLAVGTDIVGSVRHPASFCGLVGFKPSQGRVPYMPPGAPSLCAGPMARSLNDLCLLMNVIAQPDKRDVSALAYDGVDYLALDAAPLRGMRVAYAADLGFGLALDGAVEAHIERAVESLGAQGAKILRLEPPFSPGEQHPVERFYQARYNVELSALALSERERSPVISPWARQAEARSAQDLFADMQAAASLRTRTMAMTDGVDFLVLPTVPVPPYAAEAAGHDPDDFFLSWCNTFLFNITEQPCISIPCGLTETGLPIGLQVVGHRFDDTGVVRVARSLERLLEPIGPWPRPENASIGLSR
jgi:aspartyl-tRNA(Asn)/glutamyl-tRNA(Gln) amidotransferase subunit A